MAISKIKKIEVLGLEENKDILLALLQKLGSMQLIEARNKEAPSSIQAALPQTPLSEIEEAIAYLAGFKEKAGAFTGIVKVKPLVYAQELNAVIAGFNYQDLLKELSVLRNHLKNIQQHQEKLIQERHLLGPWRNLNIPLDELHPTQGCGILLGVLRSADYENLLAECQAAKINLFCEIVHQDKTNTYLVIFYILEEFEELEVILKQHHFNFVTLSRYRRTVKDRLLEINRELLVLDDQRQDAKDKIQALARQQFKLMLVHDYLFNLKSRQVVDEKLARQQFTFYLAGWIKAKEEESLTQTITKNFKDVAIFVSEPKDEEPPVVLENPRLIQPFEFITQIYGMPKYNELDPTPYLAPFFFLYFGFCVSDAGYGFLLILFCYFMLKKFRFGPQGLRFFRLFLYCGISTVIVGALTGSWFGNLLDIASESNKAFLPLKNFKDSLIILDPLKEPTKLLGVALSFGIIQVWFGNIVAGIGNLKNRRYLDILLDQVTMLTLLFGLTGLGLIFLNLLGKTHISLFKYAALIGSSGIILTQGRREKGLGAKLFYGFFTLYNSLSGYLSDILSYSRLWALGLVTTVMANTINLLSVQFSQIIISLIPILNKVSFVKIIVSSTILLVIFAVGHVVSFLMNLLGAFVHPVRLQFVEFFSKFFKSGGSCFKPFKIETKYINLT